MMNRNSIVLACIVKNWLYLSWLIRSLLDQASCERTISARMPPTTMKAIVNMRYIMPIFLWSVVVSHSRSQCRSA